MSQPDLGASPDTSLSAIEQKRREERLRVQLEGPTLRLVDGDWEPVIVQDLSSRGFRTDWPGTLVPGDAVWLKLPGLDALSARVAWGLDNTIGCKFDVALRPAVFARVLDQIR